MYSIVPVFHKHFLLVSIVLSTYIQFSNLSLAPIIFGEFKYAQRVPFLLYLQLAENLKSINAFKNGSI